MTSTVKINHKAVEEVLTVMMRKPIDEMAARIAAQVDVGNVVDAKVEVRSYTTDRAAAAVTIVHPAGIAMEAKHGTLRRAAAAEGLEVHAPKEKKSK